jgi:hypothetical protein
MPLRTGITPKWGPITIRDDHAAAIGDLGEFKSGGQQASVRLDMTVGGYMQPADPTDTTSDQECYVVADLGAGTVVSPGPGWDDTENRGYYTHAVDVQMWFDDVYVVDTETPAPSAASGSSSVSSGTSETVGFFGDQLTATGSWSTGQGGGRAYQDYETTSMTTHKSNLGGSEVMKQHLALRLCDAGGYVSPFSLVDSKQYLVGLPPRATGNLPLLSATSFMASAAPKRAPADAKLHVSIKLVLVKVTWWKESAFAVPDTAGWQVHGVNSDTFAGYDPATGPGAYPMTNFFGGVEGAYIALPWTVEFPWTFGVDFANGKVVKQ